MLTRTLLLAAHAAVLVSAQTPPQYDPVPGCTTDSFAIPSWYVQDLQYSGANASFHILNRANNFTADLACEVKDGDWTSCSIQGKPSSNDTFLASIQVSGDSAQVLLNQTWICNDREGTEPLKFISFGNNSVAMNCTDQGEEGQSCEAVDSPLLVRGTLLSPVTLTPVYAAGPVGHDTPGCMAKSESPSWTLSKIYFVDQQGDGNTSMPMQSLILQVVNDATGYHAGCMPANDPNNPAAITCAGYEFGELGTDRYHMATTATFDPKTLEFSVNQTWYCDDVDPARPVSIVGAGSMVLPLNCTTTKIKDDPNGNTRRVCDSEEEVTVKGSIVSTEKLTPYSIEDPMRVADGCTLSSILEPVWTLSAFEVNSDTSSAAANDSSSSVISFGIILQTQNPGFQYPVSITQGKKLEGSDWHECVIGGGGDTGQLLWPRDCTVKYSPATKEISLNSEWVCSDLDPNHPVLFSGMMTTTVDSTLDCETTDDISKCFTTDTAYTWTANITDITWKPAEK